MATITIGGRKIGDERPAYIIAELSGNHNQDLDRAKQLVREAKRAGADAIKLQTYTADTLTIDSDRPEFRVGKGTVWEGKTLHRLYTEAFTPWEWHKELFDLASSLGLQSFSSAFDASSVAFLSKLKVPAFKVASFEVVDLALIRRVAATGKPMILSTGMATKREIAEAVHAARQGGAKQLALLRCNSAYPASPEEMDLRTIADMRKEWGVPIGLSDHTLGGAVAVAAVALGACILEKHVTISRKDPGPDAAFSMEPDEFRSMVEEIRSTEKALGRVRYGPTAHEKPSAVFRRSLFVVEDVEKGEMFTPKNVRSIRPGYGLPPKHLDEVLGRRARKDIDRGTPLAWAHVGATRRAPKRKTR